MVIGAEGLLVGAFAAVVQAQTNPRPDQLASPRRAPGQSQARPSRRPGSDTANPWEPKLSSRERPGQPLGPHSLKKFVFFCLFGLLFFLFFLVFPMVFGPQGGGGLGAVP